MLELSDEDLEAAVLIILHEGKPYGLEMNGKNKFWQREINYNKESLNVMWYSWIEFGNQKKKEKIYV